jgi:hypothetical protein
VDRLAGLAVGGKAVAGLVAKGLARLAGAVPFAPGGDVSYGSASRAGTGALQAGAGGDISQAGAGWVFFGPGAKTSKEDVAGGVCWVGAAMSPVTAADHWAPAACHARWACCQTDQADPSVLRVTAS